MRRRTPLVTVLWLAVLWGTAAHAQERDRDFLVFDDPRVSSAVVSAVGQGPGGRLLIGTRDALYRFDGERLELHPAQALPGDPEERFEGQQPIEGARALATFGNAVWLGNHRGLFRITENGGVAIELSGVGDGQAPGVSHVVADLDGAIWVGRRRGLWRVARGANVAEPFVADGWPESTRIRALAFDQERTVYAVAGRALFAIDTATRQATELRVPESTGKPLALFATPERTQLVTSRGVWRIVGNALQPETIRDADGQPIESIQGAAHDGFRNLWLTTRSHLHVHVPWRKATYTFDRGRQTLAGRIVASHCDHENGLWLGTDEGLVRAEPARFASAWTPTRDPKTGGRLLTTHALASLDGDAWIGTDRDGLWRRRAADSLERVPLSGRNDATVTGMAALDAREVLVASSVGLHAASPDGVRAIWTEDAVTCLAKAGSARTGESRFWFGTQGGALLELTADGSVSQRGTPAPDLSAIAVRDDSLWAISSSRGLLHLTTDGQQLALPAHPEFDPSTVQSLTADGDQLWVASVDRLWRIEDRDGPKVEPRAHGGGRIGSIWRLDGTTWMTVNGRLSVLHDAESHERPAQVSGSRLATLAAVSASKVGSLVTFTGAGGLLHVQVGARQAVHYPMLVTGVAVDDEPVDAWDGVLELEPSQFVNIDVSALAFAAPFRHRYEFELIADERAIRIGPQFGSEVVLSSLPAGLWSVRGRSASDDGAWSPWTELGRVRMAAPPAPADTWQPLALGALLLAALTLVTLGWRRSRRRHQPTSLTLAREALLAGSVDEVVGIALRFAVQSTGADAGRVAVRQDTPTGAFYHLRAVQGWDDQEFPEEPVASERIDAMLATAPTVTPHLHTVASDPWCATGSTIAMRIEVRDRNAAWLLLDWQDTTPDLDFDALEAEHGVLSAALGNAHLVESLFVRDSLKRDLVERSVHDMRNPLQTVGSATELIRDALSEDRVNEETLDNLEAVRKAVSKMTDRLTAMVTEHGSEDLSMPLRLEPQNFIKIVRGQVAWNQHEARRKNITLEFEGPTTDQVILEVERVRMERVIDNLISNAIKFTHHGGRVTVSVRVSEDAVEAHVRDNGQGLHPDELPHLFRPGRRFREPTAGEPSSGLGLVIAREIVERHGGTIRVHSEFGAGSTFAIKLPLHVAKP